jgi:adenylate cyclase
MGAVTFLVLDQMRRTLVQQVIERGESQARSLAQNSAEPLLTGGDLTLLQFVQDAMRVDSEDAVRTLPSGHAAWQDQALSYIDLLNHEVQKYLWPNEPEVEGGDVEYVRIIDKNGFHVADNDIQKVMERAAYQVPPGTKALGEEALLSQAYRYKNRTLYDIAAPVLNTAEGRRDKIGEVHVGMNQNTITRVVRYVAVDIILITLAVLLLGILIMTVFVTVMVKPIRLLVRGVDAIAAGNFDQKINIRRADELGDLTAAFNDMARSLMEKEKIKGAFNKYVNKDILDRILQHQDGLKLGGEKKMLTVFFSDIRGFTPMSEALSPEEVVHILNEYFTAMTAIIFKYGGYLDKFMGDAIMALYGAPMELPDHADRAVLAAVEMSEKMKELQAKWRLEGKREVNIGIGINTGEVVVGNIGSNERMEFTAIGDTVNLTQRLESVAEKGQILISGATYERVKHRVNAVMLDPIKVKGKTEKVIAYSVQGLKTG